MSIYDDIITRFIEKHDMPVKIIKKGDRYTVKTPGGVKAKGTTKTKAKAQKRLLNAIEHEWKPKKR